MGTPFLVSIVACVGLIGIAVLVVVFGYRLGELMYLGAAVLPCLWLSRWNEYKLTIGESTLALLWGAFAFLILAGLLTGSWRTARMMRPAMRWVTLSLGALVVWMLLTNAVHCRGANDLLRGLVAVLFVILPFLAARSVVCWCRLDEAGVRRSLLSLMLAGDLLSLMTLATAVAPGAFSGLGVGVTYETYGYARGYSPLGGANGTGMILVMVYSVALGQLFARRLRPLSAATVVLSFLAVLGTLARGAFLGLIVATVYMLFSRPRGVVRRLVIAGAVGVFLLIPAVYKLSQYYTLERLSFSEMRTAPDGSVGLRMDTMKASLSFGLRNPIAGGGWGLIYEKPRVRFSYAPGLADRTFLLDGRLSLTTPHSLPGLLLVEAGIPGLMGLLVVGWALWRALAGPDPRIDPEGLALATGFRGGVLSFFAVSLVQDNLFLADRVAYCFYLFAFTGAAVAAYHRWAVAAVVPTVAVRRRTMLPLRVASANL